MRVFYTQGALSDLEHILGGLQSINPLAAASVERSISATIIRLANWPRSARMVTQWKEGNLRVVPLVRYPYVIFYQVKKDRIEILHVRHTSRASWKVARG
jgi:plasmid stabilization system protein ParE